MGEKLFFSQILAFLILCCSVDALEQLSDNNRRICWECTNSRSDVDCFRNGKWKFCEKNEFCFIEQRKENGIEVHTRGCKQDVSCDSMISRNQLSCLGPVVAEHMSKFPTSPMRCQHCCFEDYCNPTKVMQDTLLHLFSFHSKKESSFFLRQHQATSVKSIRGRQSRIGEIYYPGFGWIQWPKGALQSGSAIPPFKNVSKPIKLPIDNDQAKKTTSDCRFIKIREECTMLPPTSCVADGTFVLRIEKYNPEMEGLSNKKKTHEGCPRTPTVDTLMVYDEGDHYVLINRINHRMGSNLPFRKPSKFFVGNELITDYYTRETIKGFKKGRG